MIEVWKDIQGYEGYYQVSNLGRVRSLDRNVQHNTKHGNVALRKGKILKCKKDLDGYSIINLSKQNNRTNKKVCRLVAQAFIPNFQNKPQVNHKDGNKSNDNVENLEWVTAKENMQHALKTGLRCDIKRRKRVAQYDMENNLIKIWNGIQEASKVTKANHITDCCKGRRNKSKGYKWRYVDE